MHEYENVALFKPLEYFPLHVHTAVSRLRSVTAQSFTIMWPATFKC